MPILLQAVLESAGSLKQFFEGWRNLIWRHKSVFACGTIVTVEGIVANLSKLHPYVLWLKRQPVMRALIVVPLWIGVRRSGESDNIPSLVARPAQTFDLDVKEG